MVLDEYNRTNQAYLQKLGVPKAEYMAVGHSPQFFNKKGINSILDGRLWRCDIGMSRAFIGDSEANTDLALKLRMPTVLEILNDTIINRLGTVDTLL